jgi:molybdenum cofactor guanylyltransferase
MLTLAILAGGKSKRMGRDKSVLPFQGEVLIQRIINRLAGLASEVIIIAPRTQESVTMGFRVEEDLLPERGPLGGLFTALSATTNEAVALVACDMPFVSAELFIYQLDILVADNVDVVVPSSEKGLEPLHAIYRRNTSLPVVRRAINSGEQRLISWFPDVKVRILSRDETRHFDPRGLSFLNINTPEELALAERLNN